MKHLFILFTLFASGCQEYADYKRNEHKVTIVPKNAGIGSADIAEWKVGPLRRQRVSKGLRVKLNFPVLDKEHIKDLVSSMEIDSWFIRVRKKTMVTSEVLDHFYVPLTVPGRGKTDLRIKQISSAFVNIYYSAAAISSRFAKFPCPAFDHRKFITDFEVTKVQGRQKSIRGNRRIPSYHSGKLKVYDYSPFPINGGKELSGEYQFEIALFNAKEKTKKSNWFLINDAVKITKEGSLGVIKGCKDFKIPDNNSTIDDIQDFKFGR